MEINSEKRDEIFDKYSKANNEYWELFKQLDVLDEEISQAHKKTAQTMNTYLLEIEAITKLEHTRLKLEDTLHQRGKECQDYARIINGWASGNLPLPTKE